MAVISTQRRWHTKPPLGARVNWAHPLTRGLVAAWLFNEGGGFARPQSIIPLATPSAVAGAQKWENIGELGGYFDGSSVVSYGDVKLVTGGQMSVVMSIRPDNLTQASGILNKRTSASSEAYSIGLNYVASSEFCFNVGDVSLPTAPGTAYRWATTGWSTARYQQITLTHDSLLGASSKMLCYRDGQAIALKLTDNDTGGSPMATADAVEFGRVNAGAGNKYSGGIAYCYIFNTALSPNEIAQLYLSPYAVMLPMPRRTWGAQAAAASTVKFRKTLSSLGTRTGSRQG